ncbi:hypothetical protein IYW40_16005 [Methylocystis sp. H4A]|jgi:hypothetical protein|uniref:hypothetical protein n=1 Tax=Methylocystis sp. H4A TaxID=2785788 RepID=UPI0018C2982E|nr:hypothetical protein [Methylocystis sp. H4A]MBG0802968.1 hypothetical protein [Methylocystis sp. H4A]
MSRNVLVRAFAAEPVAMMAVGMERGLVYVANPNSAERLKMGLTEAVGVPEEDVFDFDADIYREFKKRWELGERDFWR